jgi:hypothetical protein
MRPTGRNMAGIFLTMLYGIVVTGGVLLTLIAIHAGDAQG